MSKSIIIIIIFLLFVSFPLFSEDSELVLLDEAEFSILTENIRFNELCNASGSDALFVENPYFNLGFSEKHNLSLWVSYVSAPEKLTGSANQKESKWKEDPSELISTAVNIDYVGINYKYKRGHLAPAEDFKFDQEAMDYTHLFSNAAPQASYFNQNNWKELEEHIRDIVKLRNTRACVITGPIVEELPTDLTISEDTIIIPRGYRYFFFRNLAFSFSDLRDEDPTDNGLTLRPVDFDHPIGIFDTYAPIDAIAIGRRNIMFVPTHFYKIVRYMDNNDVTVFALPNTELVENIGSYKDAKNQYSKERLEQITGLTFFTKREKGSDNTQPSDPAAAPPLGGVYYFDEFSGEGGGRIWSCFLGHYGNAYCTAVGSTAGGDIYL